MNPILVEIPKELANLQLPAPELKLFYENINNRVIWIETDIDDALLDVSKYILQWNREDINLPIEERKPIKLIIHTFGGELYACLSLVNVMNLSKTPIYTYNIGMCASAGALIFIAGTKKFTCTESTFLIHGGSCNLEGTSSQVIDNAENYKKMQEKIKAHILLNTTMDKKTLNKNYKNEWYITPDECIKYGIADEILTDISSLF
ncbi:MAG: ATP-dependent Clp protease proteolytic subunit [bacterium]